MGVLLFDRTSVLESKTERDWHKKKLCFLRNWTMKCSFEPYEGSESYIFVSYSHKDDLRVAPILDRMVQEGFRIWYDEGIEWGSEWPDSVATHLKNSAICIAFHSETSILSTNCRQEIRYALKSDKTVFSIYLEEVELSDGMDMQLSSIQSTYPFRYDDKEKFFLRLLSMPILQVCRSSGAAAPAAGNTPQPANISSQKMLDEQINEKFQQIFSKDVPENPEKSPLKARLEAAHAQKFISELEKRIAENPDRKADVPLPEEAASSGKHFCIPDLPGYKTCVFEIFRNVTCKSMTEFYTAEELVHEHLPPDENGQTGTVYYVQTPSPDGNQLVVLHFNAKSGEAMVNSGVLLDDEVRLSKHPARIQTTILQQENPIPLNRSAYNAEHLPKEPSSATGAVGHFWKEETSISNTAAIIIDPETARPLKRELRYDEAAHKWRAWIKIRPGKTYFTFQVQNAETSTVENPLTDLQIAEYYRDGRYDFQQDVFKAAEYYEKDGSPRALYEIAHLFCDCPNFYDEEAYLEYLHQAADANFPKAINELEKRQLL